MKQKTKFKQTEIGKIPEDWEETKLGVIAKINMGQSPPSITYNLNQEGLPFFQGIKDFEDKFPVKTLYCSDPKKVAETGEILLSVRAPVGKVNVAIEKCCIGRGLASLHMKNKNDEFLYYLLEYYENNLKQIFESEGTVFGCANKTGLNEFNVITPKSFPEQTVIASILSSLDAKIELNNKINKTLEVIGQAIFKKWFVDGKKEGWEKGKLGELGTFKNGINYLRDEVGDTEFSIVNVRNISNNKWILKNSLDKIKLNYNKAKKYLLNEKDILIARSACPGKISLILGDISEVIYSGFSICYRLKNLEDYFYISFILQGLKEELKNFSIGTTLSSVNQETLKNIKINLPDDESLRNFNKLIKPIFKQISVNCFQSQTLSQMRDTLLPKLMSGKVRVK